MVESIVRYRASNGHEFETEDEALREEARVNLQQLIDESLGNYDNDSASIVQFILCYHDNIIEFVNDYKRADTVCKARFDGLR